MHSYYQQNMMLLCRINMRFLSLLASIKRYLDVWFEYSRCTGLLNLKCVTLSSVCIRNELTVTCVSVACPLVVSLLSDKMSLIFTRLVPHGYSQQGPVRGRDILLSFEYNKQGVFKELRVKWRLTPCTVIQDDVALISSRQFAYPN